MRLYFDRNQKALSLTAKKYGKYCTSISRNILGNDVEGEYTLEYLTKLQDKISNAMVNKEIPFVVASGVYENLNCIIVEVTTEDETELEKVYALDTIGGAIKVGQGEEMSYGELIFPKFE